MTFSIKSFFVDFLPEYLTWVWFFKKIRYYTDSNGIFYHAVTENYVGNFGRNQLLTNLIFYYLNTGIFLKWSQATIFYYRDVMKRGMCGND